MATIKRELSVEEKAKAYDEAIERAKCYKGHDVKCAMEYVFPELKETNDEKIRTKLLNLLKELLELGGVAQDTWSMNDCEQFIAWLEKQGDKDKFIEKELGCIKGYRENAIKRLEELENQSEQKPADKVEPKFHEGEWITNDDYTWQIVNITDLDYILQSQNGHIVNDTISYVNEYFHSYTIQDAKDGDVLENDISVFIYAKVLCGEPYAYCGVDKFGVFKDNCLKNNWSNRVDNIHPAIKEKRDLLFQKMKEAGYEWDAEKKKLRKIEDEPENYKQQVMSEMTDLVKDYIKQKFAWSKEDKQYLEDTLTLLEGNRSAHTYGEVKNWLKSLRPQSQWNPSDEQLYWLKWAVNRMPDTEEANEAEAVLEDLLEQLKKLK